MEYISAPAYTLWSPESKNAVPGRHIAENKKRAGTQGRADADTKSGLAHIGAGFRKPADIRHHL